MKTLVIVPAYNEEESLPGVIQDLRDHMPDADILVVDDGSRDHTALAAKKRDVLVVSLPFNLGIGGAMQTGYLYAWKNGYDIAIQFDGDGQHKAEEIGSLIGTLESGRADMVVGSRFLRLSTYRPSFFRQLGIWIFSKVLSAVLGMKVTDPTSGFRAVNYNVLTFFAHMYPEDYPEVESIVLLHRAGMRTEEVAVDMRNRTGGRSSITPVRSVYYMVKVLLAVFIDLLKRK